MSVKAEHLLALCTVAREGSVTAAADALGLSQPAVSRQLLALQERVGAPLYERSGRGVALTPAGRDLLPYACAVAEALGAARRFVAGDRGDGVVRLRVGLSHHLTVRLTAPLLRAARDAGAPRGDLQLHLYEDYSRDLLARLERGQLDAAWLLGDPGTGSGGDVTAVRVGEERIVLLVKADDPLGRDALLPLSALEGEAVVLPSSASLVYRRTVDALERTGIRPGRVIEVSGPAAVRSATLGGMGIGVGVASFVAGETMAGEAMAGEAGAGGLRVVGIEASGFVVGVTRLVRAPHHLSPAAARALRRVIDALATPVPARASDPAPRE